MRAYAPRARRLRAAPGAHRLVERAQDRHRHDPERDDERVFVVSGEQLVALDATDRRSATGVRDRRQGRPRRPACPTSRSTAGRRRRSSAATRSSSASSPPTGSTGGTRRPATSAATTSVTGRLKWRFNTIPQPGELGHETWEDGSWEHTGASNVWTVASADEELGYAYLPTATPTHNWYGGHRPGDNLFAETLLCLECETGRRVWHYSSCDPPRRLGLRHRVDPDPGRHHRRRAADQGGRAGDQASVRLRLHGPPVFGAVQLLQGSRSTRDTGRPSRFISDPPPSPGAAGFPATVPPARPALHRPGLGWCLVGL